MKAEASNDVFTALAQFAQVYPALKETLSQMVSWPASQPSSLLRNACLTFAGMLNDLANLWRAPAPAPAAPEPEATANREIYFFRVNYTYTPTQPQYADAKGETGSYEKQKYAKQKDWCRFEKALV